MKEKEDTSNDQRTLKKDSQMRFWRKVVWKVIKVSLLLIKIFCDSDDC